MAHTKRIELAPTATKAREKAKPRLEVTRKEPKTAAKAPAATARRRRDEPPAREPELPTPEFEFMQAMQDYKKSSGRMFPTWSEVLEVLQGLGYRKSETAPAALQPISESA